MNEAELARLIELAWDGEPPTRSGPRRRLSVSEVVDAAIALADEGGLDACSMPRLAKELGVGTMSLYRYVPSKDVLTLLMSDRTAGDLSRPTENQRGWDDVLRSYAANATTRLTAHPWLLDVPAVGFPQTPRLLVGLERGLAALADAGFGPQQQLGTMLLLDGHVTATARLARAGRDQPTDVSEPPRERVRAAALPQLAALLTTGALADDDFADYGLAFGVDRIIDGTRALLA